MQGFTRAIVYCKLIRSLRYLKVVVVVYRMDHCFFFHSFFSFLSFSDETFLPVFLLSSICQVDETGALFGEANNSDDDDDDDDDDNGSDVDDDDDDKERNMR